MRYKTFAEIRASGGVAPRNEVDTRDLLGYFAWVLAVFIMAIGSGVLVGLKLWGPAAGLGLIAIVTMVLGQAETTRKVLLEYNYNRFDQLDELIAATRRQNRLLKRILREVSEGDE